MKIQTDFFGRTYILATPGLLIYPHAVSYFEVNLPRKTLVVGLQIADTNKIQFLQFYGNDALDCYSFLSNHKHSRYKETVLVASSSTKKIKPTTSNHQQIALF